jgi:hypothetical protein
MKRQRVTLLATIDGLARLNHLEHLKSTILEIRTGQDLVVRDDV